MLSKYDFSRQLYVDYSKKIQNMHKYAKKFSNMQFSKNMMKYANSNFVFDLSIS